MRTTQLEIDVNKFKKNIDCIENIVCLCPTCHRRIHFGSDEEKRAINYCETEGFNPGEKIYTIEEFYIDHGIKQMYKLHCGDNYSFEGWFNADIKTKQSIDSISFIPTRLQQSLKCENLSHIPPENGFRL